MDDHRDLHVDGLKEETPPAERYIVLGTAGHVDHGKTTLVKALTGRDTDRLKEEKERGISIDLGFAPFTLPDGRKIGVVDVPGHEKFIKNMLAGAAGIDFILLVVDALEGVMPQTREHLQILDLLNVQKGIIVVTKTDLAEPEWLELVQEEVREAVRGTFLEGAPVHPVSAVTGEGIGELREAIVRMADSVRPRESSAPLRLPVDRVFHVSGFGTVVTGTLIGGRVAVGQTVEVLPAGVRTRVRSIQVHGHPVQEAFAGQRAALNLPGVDKSQAERGSVVAEPDLYQPTRLIDVRLRLLPDAPRPVPHRMRVRLYLGTSEVFGRVSLLDRDVLEPGDDALAQIHLEEPVVCESRDRFIIRSYSPMWTLGGGSVIDPRPERPYRRRRESILAMLEERERGGPREALLLEVRRIPGRTVDELARAVKLTKEETERLLEQLRREGRTAVVGPSGGWMEPAGIGRLLGEIEARIRDHYRAHPYTRFVPKAQVLSQLEPKLRPKVYDDLLNRGVEAGRFEVRGDRLCLAGYEVTLSPEDRALWDRIRKILSDHPFNPPDVDQLAGELRVSPGRVLSLLRYGEEQGAVVELEEGLFMTREALIRAKRLAEEKYRAEGPFTVAMFRDWLGVSRKFAVAILEFFDRSKMTRRVGDVRHVSDRPFGNEHGAGSNDGAERG
ncbi:MAG: selenocysteine-specific translation elongation factor [Alicyclobacillaceae bacterium]|nr:selenocysteine-specific translation elongation factor [Alicyclobacillaceae bacterium]